MVDDKCPKWSSDDVDIVDYMGAKCIVCKQCGYDESEELAVYPEERSTQRDKEAYNPYKSGGAQRVVKKSNQ